MIFCSVSKRSVLLICLFYLVLGSLHPNMVLAQSAWLANHFMAKKIDRRSDSTTTITEYPIICCLSGPGPYHFDSYTQIITGRGKHKIKIQIIQDATNKFQQMNKYTIESAYDGYIDEHICDWSYTSEDSGWYRMEILLEDGSETSEVVGIFYFYVHYKQ